MAVNPAAANPNQFANTNLDGGKAEMAMWGGNTNPPLPSTPQNAQPNAASVASAMNSPNSLALSNTTPTSFANPVPQAQQDWVSHNMAMLQQMAAGPQRQAAPAQPTYGVDADNNLQIGDSIIPMGQNPTAAAQALQSPQAQQGTANLRPGFRPVSASDVQAYLQNVGANRGVVHALGETGKQFVGGAVGGGLDLAGRAAQWANMPNAGQALIDAGHSADQFLGTDLPPDTMGHGRVASGFINNARGAGLAVPIMAANMGLTAAGMPEVAGALDVGVVAPLFGAADAQTAQQQALKNGASPEQANAAGWKQFFLSGGTQAALAGVGAAASTGTYGALQRLKAAVSGGELTADQAAQMVTNPAFWKRFAVNQAGNTAVQSAGMGAQAAGTAAIQNAANPNGQQQDVLGAGLEGAESGLYNTAMMAPLGAYHQWGDSGRRSALGRDLNSPLNPVDMFDAARTAVGRDNAAAAIQPEVSGLTSKDKADAWQKGVVDKSLNDLVDTMQAKDRAEYDAVTNAKPEAPKPSVTTTQEQYNQLFGKDSEHAKQSAAAPATTAEQEAADLAAQDAIKAVGIGRKNKQGQEMARQAIALGIDLESADAEKLVRALKSSKFALAQTEIDRLKGGTDGTARPADGGTDAGGVDGRGNAGGDVGAGDVAGSAAAGRGAGAAAGNEAAHGAPVDGAGGERPAAKLKAADIPDFSLTPPSGSPNMNWIAANHEPTTEITDCP